MSDATCDIPTLIDGSRCYDCIVDQGLFLPAMLYLLCKTTEGVKVNCDPETLANDSRCFACEIPEGYVGATILNVLCQLNQKSLGATCLVCGTGDPVDTPPCDCSLYVGTGATTGVPTLWFSNDGVNWHPLIYAP